MAVAALNKQAQGYRSANYWLLLLSIDLATLLCFKHKRVLFKPIWRSDFLMCFLHHCRGFTPLPWFPITTMASHHHYISICSIGIKLSKMAGNSTNCSFKSSSTKITWMTVQQWRIAWKQLHEIHIMHWIIELHILTPSPLNFPMLFTMPQNKHLIKSRTQYTS